MGFIENLNWRYATKKFDGRKLPAEVLEKILTAIRMAPSSFGIQPYHISVIENDRQKSAQSHLWDHQDWNRDQLDTCSHVLVFNADLNIEKRAEDFVELSRKFKGAEAVEDPEFDYAKEAAKFGKRMGPEWPARQAYIALGFALAACAELKVDSCPMEAFDAVALNKFLGLPQNLEPKVLLAVGYRSPEDGHAKEPKIRFSKEDLFGLK